MGPVMRLIFSASTRSLKSSRLCREVLPYNMSQGKGCLSRLIQALGLNEDPEGLGAVTLGRQWTGQGGWAGKESWQEARGLWAAMQGASFHCGRKDLRDCKRCYRGGVEGLRNTGLPEEQSSRGL